MGSLTVPYDSPGLELRDRVRWYVNMRWFYLMPLAAAGLVPLYIASGFSEDFRRQTTIALIGFGLNAGFWLLLRFGPRRKTLDLILAASQVGLDILLATWLIYENGGIESRSIVIYAIPILMTGALLGRLATYLSAAASALSYALLSTLDHFGVVRPPNVVFPQLHGDFLYYIRGVLFYAAIFVILAVITDYVGRLVRDRERLVHKVQVVSAEKAEIEAILKSMGSALMAIDRQGLITMVNDSFEELTGWTRQEVVGQPLDTILPIFDETGRRLKAAKRPMLQFSQLTKATPPVRAVNGYTYVRKDGSSFPFTEYVTPVVLGNRVVGATSVFDDVTDSKNLDQLKNNFVALVSHQLKTPIGEIRGYVENMLYGLAGPVDPRQEDYLHKISEVAKRSDKLITDLLDITVLEKGGLQLDLRPVHLSAVIDEVLRIYEQRLTQKKLSLRVFEETPELTVEADANKLVEVISNVIANSISYSKRGTITIKTKRLDGRGEICIKDEGSGMDKATLNALFHKDTVLSGAPTAEGGTGLGLYLAKQLVNLMQGEIRVASTSARGTTICITLPLVKG